MRLGVCATGILTSESGSALHFALLDTRLSALPCYISVKTATSFNMAVQTGLDYMRSRTFVDCDTMDDEGMHSTEPWIHRFVRHTDLI